MQNTKSINNSKYHYNPYNRSKIFPKRKYSKLIFFLQLIAYFPSKNER